MSSANNRTSIPNVPFRSRSAICAVMKVIITKNGTVKLDKIHIMLEYMASASKVC
jgi:hypothetical protein